MTYHQSYWNVDVVCNWFGSVTSVANIFKSCGCLQKVKICYCHLLSFTSAQPAPSGNGWHQIGHCQLGGVGVSPRGYWRWAGRWVQDLPLQPLYWFLVWSREGAVEVSATKQFQLFDRIVAAVDSVQLKRGCGARGAGRGGSEEPSSDDGVSSRTLPRSRKNTAMNDNVRLKNKMNKKKKRKKKENNEEKVAQWEKCRLLFDGFRFMSMPLSLLILDIPHVRIRIHTTNSIVNIGSIPCFYLEAWKSN